MESFRTGDESIELTPAEIAAVMAARETPSDVGESLQRLASASEIVIASPLVSTGVRDEFEIEADGVPVGLISSKVYGYRGRSLIRYFFISRKQLFLGSAQDFDERIRRNVDLTDERGEHSGVISLNGWSASGILSFNKLKLFRNEEEVASLRNKMGLGVNATVFDLQGRPEWSAKTIMSKEAVRTEVLLRREGSSSRVPAIDALWLTIISISFGNNSSDRLGGVTP